MADQTVGISNQLDTVDQLNKQDCANLALLDQVVDAANAISKEGKSDLAVEDSDKLKSTDDLNKEGKLKWGDKVASLQGTGGVALLEYAKDAIQTAVSNIATIGKSPITLKNKVENIVTRG